ncbi:iron ABC transporter permease [Niallia alba]|uniref:FecCD family ABC transporter permease n=1 Tax=Niallia alba TaxID=2729105 RepID=UPI000C792D28|nr:iron ABC transporter permease [Niallia alba]MED3794522.1 iron ABC transporter permease [Niallia alba]
MNKGRERNKIVIYFLLVSIFLVLMIVYSALKGSIPIGISQLVSGLIHGGDEQVEVIKDLRFPRIIVAIFTGAVLSVSGVLFQAVMRNPLAEAGILGISSGASFFTFFGILFLPGWYISETLFSFIGGTIACIIIYWLSWKSGLKPLRVILTGIAISAMFTGLRDALINICSFLNISVGATNASNLTMKTWEDVQIIVACGVVLLAVAFFVSPWCNLLRLEDKKIANLGIRIHWVRIFVSAIAVLLASVGTSVAGVIMFAGLIIPHIARQLIGTNHYILIPFSALSGALLLLSADTFGRLLIAPLEIPASTLMAIIGGPFLIFLLRKGEKINGI